jgi:Family of unknown function (DUF6338)
VIPNGVWAAVVVLALVPGWVYLRLRERHAPPNGSSGLAELLDVVGVGLATTGTAACLAVFVPHRWMPFLADLGAWARQGDRYPSEHLRPVVATLLIVLGLAILIAFLLSLAIQRGRPAEFHASGVWINSLGKRPRKHTPAVGVELDDGRLYEGLLHSYTLEQHDNRDIALQAPIRLTMKAGTAPVDLPIARIIIPSRIIRTIGVRHLVLPEKKT